MRTPEPRIDVERWREARVSAGLSKAEIARRMGLWVQTVMRWEKGSNHPYPRNVRIYAMLTGVSIPWLYGRSDDPRRNGT